MKHIDNLDEIIKMALLEDVGDGDHSTLSCIPPEACSTAKMVAKQKGILCGVEVCEKVFKTVDDSLNINIMISDGQEVNPGDILMTVKGHCRGILTAERTALNFIQRLSGIATETHRMVALLDGLNTQLLDTRKTTPNMRLLEKYAVLCGGGTNHRIGLYDMVMLKDNHIDFAGGIEKAISRVHSYLRANGKPLRIEIEVRNLDELQRVLDYGGIHRIMLDNFDIPTLRKALKMVGGLYETEASGGITEENLRQYAETGVDFISVGALTHHIKSLDISLVKQ